MLFESLMEKARHIFREIDRDLSGRITVQEIKRRWESADDIRVLTETACIVEGLPTIGDLERIVVTRHGNAGLIESEFLKIFQFTDRTENRWDPTLVYDAELLDMNRAPVKAAQQMTAALCCTSGDRSGGKPFDVLQLQKAWQPGNSEDATPLHVPLKRLGVDEGSLCLSYSFVDGVTVNLWATHWAMNRTRRQLVLKSGTSSGGGRKPAVTDALQLVPSTQGHAWFR